MATPTTAPICSRSPEALLSFTTYTATSLLPCSSVSQKSIQNRIRATLLPSLDEFIRTVFERSHQPASVCLVALIYLQRLKSCLPKHAKGEIDTPYRLFLAAILTASKFLCEAGTALTSENVAKMTDYVYSYRDVNLMERSFLSLIGYELFVCVEDVKEYLALHEELLDMDFALLSSL
ncbi:hypothetical protein DFQ30_004017 [Apophysomyces sp. BC1015]|nr:hypothetical protein DFQ30_004017 [Apophysomyces sp. BC1015]